MGSVVVTVLAVSLGVVMSPLAVIAVVAVLFSPRARANSAAFLVGWILGSVLSIGAAYAALTALQIHERREPPLWVPLIQLFTGSVLLAGAALVYFRPRRHLRDMTRATGLGEVTSAAPQLPKILQSVAHFTPTHSALLGIALFVLNPVDVSCAIAAALDLRLSALSGTEQLLIATVFVVVGASSVAVPVAMLWIGKDRALGPLERIRTWIATNTKLLNVALLVLIAAMQINKGVRGL